MYVVGIRTKFNIVTWENLQSDQACVFKFFFQIDMYSTVGRFSCIFVKFILYQFQLTKMQTHTFTKSRQIRLFVEFFENGFRKVRS